jgi:thioesterase domain-containing protein
MSSTNTRNWEFKPTGRQRTMFNLARLVREGAIIPVVPWWSIFNDVEDDNLCIEYIHQDLEVSHFQDGNSLDIPFGLSQ